jgi:hypothetical protein
VLEAYPSVQVTVLDRPEVIEPAVGHAPVRGLGWHPADLFEPWRLEADVVLLSRVLHDWDDEGAPGSSAARGRRCVPAAA